MKIDQVFPHVVGDRCSPKEQLFQRAREQGLSADAANESFVSVSATLIDSRACLDKPDVTRGPRASPPVPLQINGL